MKAKTRSDFDSDIQYIRYLRQETWAAQRISRELNHIITINQGKWQQAVEDHKRAMKCFRYVLISYGLFATISIYMILKMKA